MNKTNNKFLNVSVKHFIILFLASAFFLMLSMTSANVSTASAGKVSFVIKLSAPHDTALTQVGIYVSDSSGNASLPIRISGGEGYIIWEANAGETIKLWPDTHGKTCSGVPEKRPMKPLYITVPNQSNTDSTKPDYTYMMDGLQEKWDLAAWDYSVEKDKMSQKEIQLGNAINNYRKSIGLNSLIVTKRMNYINKRHVLYLNEDKVDFADNSINPHCDKEGYMPATALKYAGIQQTKDLVTKQLRPDTSTGANLGYASPMNLYTARELVEAWVASPGHKALLDNPVMTHMGVAIQGDYFSMSTFSDYCVDMDMSSRNACEKSQAFINQLSSDEEDNDKAGVGSVRTGDNREINASAYALLNNKRNKFKLVVRFSFKNGSRTRIKTYTLNNKGYLKKLCTSSSKNILCKKNRTIPFRFRKSKSKAKRYIKSNFNKVVFYTKDKKYTIPVIVYFNSDLI